MEAPTFSRGASLKETKVRMKIYQTREVSSPLGGYFRDKHYDSFVKKLKSILITTETQRHGD